MSIWQIIEAYFSNSTIAIYSPLNGTSFSKGMSCGFPQGLILGPNLWNLLHNDLLRLDFPYRVKLIEFADNVAVVSTQSFLILSEESLEEYFAVINDWIAAHIW